MKHVYLLVVIFILSGCAVEPVSGVDSSSGRHEKENLYKDMAELFVDRDEVNRVKCIKRLSVDKISNILARDKQGFGERHQGILDAIEEYKTEAYSVIESTDITGCLVQGYQSVFQEMFPYEDIIEFRDKDELHYFYRGRLEKYDNDTSHEAIGKKVSDTCPSMVYIETLGERVLDYIYPI